MADNRTEVAREPTQKKWHPPALRRLPIAATSGSGKATIRANDGQGVGKGDVSTEVS